MQSESPTKATSNTKCNKVWFSSLCYFKYLVEFDFAILLEVMDLNPTKRWTVGWTDKADLLGDSRFGSLLIGWSTCFNLSHVVVKYWDYYIGPSFNAANGLFLHVSIVLGCRWPLWWCVSYRSVSAVLAAYNMEALLGGYPCPLSEIRHQPCRHFTRFLCRLSEFCLRGVVSGNLTLFN